jgi:PTS system D-glucosamine-specific IIC component
MKKNNSSLIPIILTFGIAYFFIKRKARKLASIQSNELKYNDKIKFNINNFVNKLGGKQNIVSSTSTINSLKLVLKDASNVKKENLDKFGIHGFMKNNNTLTLIFGDNAIAIKEALDKI